MQNGTTSDAEAELPASLFDLVLSRTVSREAYFNTTQGLLTGDPADTEVQQVMEGLEQRAIAYIFLPDQFRPRPAFSFESRTVVGREEILRAVGASAMRNR